MPATAIVTEISDRLPREIDEDNIRKYFLLTDGDLQQVRRCRGNSNRLGFAVQLCTLRWRGYFLPDTSALPLAVLEFLAPQVKTEAVQIPEYPQNEKTRWEHLDRIRSHLRFEKCDEAQRQLLFNHLKTQAVLMPRASALYDEACSWLFGQRIVRPGYTTVRETVAASKEAALIAVYDQLSGELDAPQKQRLDELLNASPSGNDDTPGSELEQFKLLPRRESPASLSELAERLGQIQALNLTSLPGVKRLHPLTRALLTAWGYRYNVWSLRRFTAAKRYSIILAFLQTALAETIDAVIDVQDKLITRIHNRARERRERLLRTSEQARTRAVLVLEGIGALIVDAAIPDERLRINIFSKWSSDDLVEMVAECRKLRQQDDGSYLSFLVPWFGYTRKYSPLLVASTPFDFTRCAALGKAVEYLKGVNQEDGPSFGNDAPTDFVSRRWEKYVLPEMESGNITISRPHYELALLTTLNERIKAGDVTVASSRRWTDFDEYLIPLSTWKTESEAHYTALGLPRSADEFIKKLSEHLAKITTEVNARMPTNQAVNIDSESGEFVLSPLAGLPDVESVERVKHLIEINLPRTDLVDVLVEMDNETDFLRHFARLGAYETNLSPVLRRRNAIAALIAVGCNIGPQRMAAASPELNYRDISRVSDWSFSDETLRAAVIDLVNYAASLPLSRLYGSGDTCSADGMRFYVPVNVLAADYSPVLQGRGVTLLAHTSDNYLRLFQQPIPCKLREATFNLDGLVEHDTELDPKTCFTDTHGYTEVVMATASLLGFELAPRIRDIKDQTLYKMDRQQCYPHLDPILNGTIRPELIRQSWDEVVRVIASIKARHVSPSLILQRLGSYSRQNSIHQALAEIGRVYKTIWILRYLDDEALRRRTGRELNKGEASHDLSRFLCFGKGGQLRGREIEDQLHTLETGKNRGLAIGAGNG